MDRQVPRLEEGAAGSAPAVSLLVGTPLTPEGRPDEEHRPGGGAAPTTASIGLWQAIRCPSAIGTRSGMTVSQTGSRRGQRGANGQPTSSREGSGGIPWIGRSCSMGLSMRGVERSSP